MRLRPLIVLVLLGMLAVPAAGCRQVKSVLNPPALVKHVTIAAKVGKPDAKLQGALQPGFPSNLPLWEGSGVLQTRVTKSSAGESWSATLSTSDKYADVVQGMAAGFQQQGWTVEAQDMSSADGSATVLTVGGSTGSGVVTISALKHKTTQIAYVIQRSGQ